MSSHEDLLDRLRRGRGDAVRELLAMPREAAGEVLLDCLCTPSFAREFEGDAAGYIELMLST